MIMITTTTTTTTISIIISSERERALYVVVRPSVVCNVRAPYLVG